MEIEEYTTSDLMEAAFLSFKGFDYTTDVINQSTRFIFKGDVRLFHSLLREFHAGSKEYRLLEAAKTIKKVAIRGRYIPDYYEKKLNETRK